MATVKRPTAKQVQEAWSEIEELWEDVPEDERQELLASFVTQVEVKQKDRASMKLLPIPEGHGLKFVTRSQYRAGRLVVANYPPIQFPDFEVTRIPREAPKPSNLSQVQ